MAENMNDRTDMELLDYITDISKKNVEHLGFIPFKTLPEIVSSWQCGLTIEKKCAYTLYTHHNKIYQYLALGIPAVTLKIHEDYSHLEPYVQSVENYSEFVMALETALEKSRDRQFQHNCIAVAETNSADKRAEDFLKWVEDL